MIGGGLKKVSALSLISNFVITFAFGKINQQPVKLFKI